MGLSNEQLERYSRHILLKELGEDGQRKLLEGKVLIIGVGGLGSPAALYLAAAGVGTIGLADADVVDLSNLQRQVIHTTDDRGKKKVDSAKETINALNPDVTVRTFTEFVSGNNILDLIKDYDFVLDCTDNFETKYLINDACVLAKKPFSHAGVFQFEGQVTTVIPGESPCYRCIYKNPPSKGTAPNTKEVGIVGTVPGIAGCLQATEAIKYLTGAGDLLTGSLLVFDALSMEFHKIDLGAPRKDCEVCSDHPTITELTC